MSLVEDAIDAYEKSRLENKENEDKEKKEFIEDGIKTIKDKFGDNLKIDVTSDKDGDVIFIIDGLKMKLRKYHGYYNIYLVQTCPKCGKEYVELIINLRDIGKLIKEGHCSFDCEKALKDKEPVKEWTTDEKLLDALKTFIRENSSEWI